MKRKNAEEIIRIEVEQSNFLAPTNIADELS